MATEGGLENVLTALGNNPWALRAVAGGVQPPASPGSSDALARALSGIVTPRLGSGGQVTPIARMAPPPRYGDPEARQGNSLREAMGAAPTPVSTGGGGGGGYGAGALSAGLGKIGQGLEQGLGDLAAKQQRDKEMAASKSGMAAPYTSATGGARPGGSAGAAPAAPSNPPIFTQPGVGATGTGTFNPTAIVDRTKDVNAAWAKPFDGPVKGIIIHHSGGGGGADGVISTLNQRSLGAQYVVDRDGTVSLTLPEGTAGRQIKPGWGAGQGLSNGNTIGIEFAAKNDADLTDAQKAMGPGFVQYLQNKYSVDPQAVYGHGEVNPGHKEATEGLTIANMVRDQNQDMAQDMGDVGATVASGSGPNTNTASNGWPSTKEAQAYAESIAPKAGIGPGYLSALIDKEYHDGGQWGGAGDSGSSFSPLQLHYGNQPGAAGALSKPGMGDDFTKATGLDARDPANWKAATDYAVSQIQKTGWTPWATSQGKLGWGAREGIRAGPGTASIATAATTQPLAKADAAQDARQDAGDATGGFAAPSTGVQMPPAGQPQKTGLNEMPSPHDTYSRYDPVTGQPLPREAATASADDTKLASADNAGGYFGGLPPAPFGLYGPRDRPLATALASYGQNDLSQQPTPPGADQMNPLALALFGGGNNFDLGGLGALFG